MTGINRDVNATTGATKDTAETAQEETNRMANAAASDARAKADPNRPATKAELDAVDAKTPKG